MPAKSRRQQKWAFATKGEKWARKHHFDELAAGKKKPAAKKRKPKK
jgi:hypothetical protein